MGVSGALVWCVTNDAWIPFRLDAVKLSGTITKAHWESVAELIRLLASNQLVLRAGASSDGSATVAGDDGFVEGDEEADCRPAESADASSLLTLLKADAEATEEASQNSGHVAGNGGAQGADASETAPTASGKVLPAAFGRFYSWQLDDGRNVLSLDGDRAKRVMAASSADAITFNVTTKSLDSLLSSIQQQRRCSAPSPPESVRSERCPRKNSSPIILSVSSSGASSMPGSASSGASGSAPSSPSLSAASSTSSLCEERPRRTASRRHSVALVEPLIESGEDESCSLRSEDGAPASSQYVPQETPTWLKLLQRYHDSKRLEKQIQRQREAWARNKRNLRRESVPKCVSGLSR